MKRLLALCLTGFLLIPAGCYESTAAIEVIAVPARDGWESDSAYQGFTLIAPLRSKRAHLVDMSGTSVHSWTCSETPSAATYLTRRGTLLRCLDVNEHPIFRGGGQSGWIEELDWDGTVLWEFRWDSETGVNHHDLEELPNGNILIIAWDRHTRAAALTAGRDPELLEGDEFWPDAVLEIRPTRPEGGEVVWSWHAWDHLVQDFDPQAPNFASPAARPERIDINGDRNIDPPSEEEEDAELARMAALGYAGDIDQAADADEEEEDPEEVAFDARVKDADWMHSNGVAYHAGFDQIAISVRRFDEIWIIDHSTTTEQAAGSTGGRSGKGGDLLYRWGNPFAYGLGRWEDRILLGQHHVQWIAAGQLGAGGLIVFNNGTEKERAWSSVDEWFPHRDAEGNYVRAEGRPFGPTALDWTYTAEQSTEFFSSFISGAQRLPNGNTLICSGAQGWVFEVTPVGEVVWDWRNPYGPDPEVDEPKEDDDAELVLTALFRADRYAPDHPGIVALRARGASIPRDPGAGPATNQRPEPPEEEDEAVGDG